ncbi:MAG: glycosyltransferase family 2 protein [Armatimonadota bacterium]
MNLSILIVNWNTRELLARCIESVYAHPPAVDFEVVVVDNASTDGSAAMVRERFPDVRLIANAENAGYAEGNNQGLRVSAGRHVLLLNPDTEVRPGALYALVAFMDAHPNAAAVACRLVGPDERVQRSCRSFPDPRGVLFEYLGLARLFPRSRFFGSYRMTWFDYATETEVDQPMASCLLLSRQAIDKVGMFDKEFPIFFNEVDWCYRAKKSGWKVYFTPTAEVLHHGGASTRQVKPAMVRESHRSLVAFYERYYKGRISGPLYRFIMFAIAVNSHLAAKRAERRCS